MRCDSRHHATDYFAELYAHGEIARIVATEHTGLLQRSEREHIEGLFKRSTGRHPWDPNLLSCTPSLEMGIDIGDLSYVMLCAVPPAQANYLQRIGRAGRRDVNARVVTFANARNRDLYFFEEPAKIVAGGYVTRALLGRISCTGASTDRMVLRSLGRAKRQ